MARIRSIKPEFFRHEDLQELEKLNLGKYPMLVFAGLWTLSDRFGRFEWKPRQIKLDILPFLEFDMTETLELLSSGGFVRKYQSDGKLYGEIVSFGKHQRISGKEATQDGKCPEPTREAPEKQLGIARVPLEREREGNGVHEKPGCFTPDSLMQAVATELRISDKWVKVSISEQIKLSMEAGDPGQAVAEQMIANGRTFRNSKDFKFGEWKKYFSTDNWKHAGPSAEDKLPNVNDIKEQQRKQAALVGG